MIKLFKHLYYFINLLRFLPLIIVFYLHPYHGDLVKERNIWIDVLRRDGLYTFKSFIWLLTKVPEYRTVIYFRLGNKWRFILRIFAKEKESCYLNLHPSQVGLGLVLQHGFSVIVEAIRIGENCQIWHNVTIGTNKSGTGNKAVIGNNVKVCTGAMILGKVIIGDNVTIGAGTVIVKDVPSNCVVVGNPAHVIRKDGEKCYFKL